MQAPPLAPHIAFDTVTWSNTQAIFHRDKRVRYSASLGHSSYASVWLALIKWRWSIQLAVSCIIPAIIAWA